MRNHPACKRLNLVLFSLSALCLEIKASPISNSNAHAQNEYRNAKIACAADQIKATF